MIANNQKYSTKTINYPNVRFSDNAELDVDKDDLRKTYQLQKDKHNKQLETLLSSMKQKMEEGSQIQSKRQTLMKLDNSSMIKFNNINFGGNLENSRIINNSNLGSKIISENLNNIESLQSDQNMIEVNDNNNIMNNAFDLNMNNNNFINKNINNMNDNDFDMNNNIINMNDNNVDMNNNIINMNDNDFDMNNNFIKKSNSKIMDNNVVDKNNNFMNNSKIINNNNNNNNDDINLNYNIMNNSNNIINNDFDLNDNNMNTKKILNMNLNLNQNQMISQFNLDNIKNNNNSKYLINPINNFDQMDIHNTNKSISKDSQKNSKIYDNPMIQNPNNNPNNINTKMVKSRDPILFNSNEDEQLIPFNLKKKTLIDEEQEKLDKKRKTQISERHTIELTKSYDYTPDEKDIHINELLEEMNIFGDITKQEIEREKDLNPNSFMSIEEAEKKGKVGKNISGFNNEFFVLAILAKALMSQGCTVAIDRYEAKNEKEKKEAFTTAQFLVNGMHNFKKYTFHFDFGVEKNKELLKNAKEQNLFHAKLKKKLLDLFNLKNNDIIITNPRIGSYQITAIIKKSKFNELSQFQLLQELQKVPEFSKIQDIQQNILLTGCRLNKIMLDSQGNNKDGGWGLNEKRGGKPYYPPIGWIGFGLRVLDRFENGDNTWLDYKNLKGVWCVAYHGIGYTYGGTQILSAVNDISMNNLKSGMRQQFKDSNDINHPGEKVGAGVYVTPQPEVMEEYCGIYTCGGKNYKIGLMNRVRPDRIRCPEEKTDYWVINGTDNEVRPYRILIKEI